MRWPGWWGRGMQNPGWNPSSPGFDKLLKKMFDSLLTCLLEFNYSLAMKNAKLTQRLIRTTQR